MTKPKKITFFALFFCLLSLIGNTTAGNLSCKGGHTIHIAGTEGTTHVTISQSRERSYSPIVSPANRGRARHRSSKTSPLSPRRSPIRAITIASPKAHKQRSSSMIAIPEQRERGVAFASSPKTISSTGSSPSHFPSPTTAAYREARRSESYVTALKASDWGSSPRNSIHTALPYMPPKPERAARGRRAIAIPDDIHLSDLSSMGETTDATPQSSPAWSQMPGATGETSGRFGAYAASARNPYLDKLSNLNHRQDAIADITKCIRDAKNPASLKDALKYIELNCAYILRTQTGTSQAAYAQEDLANVRHALGLLAPQPGPFSTETRPADARFVKRGLLKKYTDLGRAANNESTETSQAARHAAMHE